MMRSKYIYRPSYYLVIGCTAVVTIFCLWFMHERSAMKNNSYLATHGQNEKDHILSNLETSNVVISQVLAPLGPSNESNSSPEKRTTSSAMNTVSNSYSLKGSSHDVKKIPVRLLSKAQCVDKYGNKRRFLDAAHAKYPPMLYTFPGSGNTWGRLLIEYATSIYTGSVYNDKTLMATLPGESHCDKKVSVLKFHPHTHKFDEIRKGTYLEATYSDGKCKVGGISGIKRAVLLIRDPFDSIWSEFQRRITQSHVSGISKKTFNWHRWQANAAALSNLYHHMWSEEIERGIEKHYAPQDILYVRFEDLRDADRRVEALHNITQFLDLHPAGITTTTASTTTSTTTNPFSSTTTTTTTSTTTGGTGGLSLTITAAEREKLECAFLLADKKSTHRSVNPSTTMTKQDAYITPLVCRMWAKFGKYASKHGYSIWKNTSCEAIVMDQTNPIPKVAVGAKGEYDSSWVDPGKPLIDFRTKTRPPSKPNYDSWNKKKKRNNNS